MLGWVGWSGRDYLNACRALRRLMMWNGAVTSSRSRSSCRKEHGHSQHAGSMPA